MTARRLPLRLRRSRQVWFSPETWRQRLVFWGGAALLGVVAVLFALAADQAQALFAALTARVPLLPLVLTPAVFALSCALALRYFPGSQGSGIPQAIAARLVGQPAARRQLLALRTAAGKIALTLLGLAAGASLGREGPTVQIGAAIMLSVSAVTGLGRQPGLILAGGAAGVAAAFNTPLAGIVFAIEEMGRGFERRTSGLVLTAVIMAGLAARACLGNTPYFGSTAAVIDWPEAWAVVVIGGAGGLAGGLFSRAVIVVTRRLPQSRLGRLPVVFAGLCGFAIAAIGLAGHGLTFGSGYGIAAAMLAGQAHPGWAYPVLKLLATAISAVAGIPGGIFAPSLSVGAGIGAALAPFAPAGATGAMVLLGMTAYFTGVVQAPITAVVIVMEMTDNQSTLLPLMATALLAQGVSRLICPEPLYHALAEGFMKPGAA